MFLSAHTNLSSLRRDTGKKVLMLKSMDSTLSIFPAEAAFKALVGSKFVCLVDLAVTRIDSVGAFRNLDQESV